MPLARIPVSTMARFLSRSDVSSAELVDSWIFVISPFSRPSSVRNSSSFSRAADES